MQKNAETDGLRRRRLNRLLLWPLCALAVFSGAWGEAVNAAGQAWMSDSAAGRGHGLATYTAIPLSEDPSILSLDINAKGQVAFTERFPNELESVLRARFFDGSRFRTLGTFGGQQSEAQAVNEFGQVTGSADTAGGLAHAFRWSKYTGLVDLSRPGLGISGGNDINNKGVVAGFAQFGPDADLVHAARWDARNAVLDLGSLFGGRSFALAINDAGTIVGQSDQRPFRWTQGGGMQQIGMFPGERAWARDINSAGYIVGAVPFREGDPIHAFVWSPKSGLMDLGTGSGTESSAIRINEKGMVIGDTTLPNVRNFGFVWTRETGLVEIGKPRASSAQDVNNHGQVVGGLAPLTAFLWTRPTGVVDLNTRVRNAPRGLRLELARAISDNGAIVVATNSGTVLLTTQPITNQAPLVGPIQFPSKLRAGVPINFVAFFTDVDTKQTHRAVWDWDDGTTTVGIVNEKNGSGSVSAQHTFAEGDFRLRLTVTDSSGKSTTVRVTLTFLPACPCVSGKGTFMSPAGASRLDQGTNGLASFAFSSPLGKSQGKGSVRFETAAMQFRSTQLDSHVQGAQVQYRGTGTLNGAPGFHFIMTATRSEDGTDRVGMRIWHRDRKTGAQVVDYDNMRTAPLAGSGPGTIVDEGAITVETD